MQCSYRQGGVHTGRCKKEAQMYRWTVTVEPFWTITNTRPYCTQHAEQAKVSMKNIAQLEMLVPVTADDQGESFETMMGLS